jgi:hypothetical protein
MLLVLGHPDVATAADDASEQALDQAPARGALSIRGQRQHAVHVVGQHDAGLHLERIAVTRRAKGKPQRVHVLD